MPTAFDSREARPGSALHQSLSSMLVSLAMQNPKSKHCLHAPAYDLAMHIGATLKKVMKERGVSPASMATHCGVTRGAVSNWFSTGRITKENLVKAANLLQVTVEALVAGDLGERTAKPLTPLPQASLADDTMTLLTYFNQLDAFKRSKVIKFALDQKNDGLIPNETGSKPKVASAGRNFVGADKGALSQLPSTGLSEERGRRGRK